MNGPPSTRPSPRFSVVTLSFNQGLFLAQAIESVLGQDYPHVEYIIVDPGSTDGSRAVVRRYADRLTQVVFQADRGPAEGLNNGFSRATGDYFGFLNADDILLPGALSTVAAAVSRGEADVLSGHSIVIDDNRRVLRRAYSDAFSARAAAYGVCVLMQPSTFFRAECFSAVSGFNVENGSHWDGELFVDMALRGARFSTIPEFLSGFRLHPGSISASPMDARRLREYRAQMFTHVMGRPPGRLYGLIRGYYLARKYSRCPAALRERLLRGPVSSKLIDARG